VIDARQAYLQEVVAEGLRALGHAKEAGNSIHFDYEIVALTPRCAAEMGYELSPEDARRPYVEVSGRRGFGVKADDLITRMLAAAESRVLQKHAHMAGIELKQTANALAVGALRFFLLKVTRNTIIAFDFEDALSAEGETGPYCQYAIVRIRGIRRKGAEVAGTRHEIGLETLKKIVEGPESSAIWRCCWPLGRWITRWTRQLGRRSQRLFRSTRFSWRSRLIIFITNTIFCRKRMRRSGRCYWD